MRGREGAARLAGSGAGPGLSRGGIVVVFLFRLLVLALLVGGLEEGAAGLGEGDRSQVAGLRRQSRGPTVAVALVVGGGGGWELSGMVRGGVVVLDDGGGGVHHGSPRGGGGRGGAGRGVGAGVDGGAEGGRGERADDGERGRGRGGGARGRGGERGERDAGEVERDGARERVRERRAVVLRREGVVGGPGAGGSGHGRRRLHRRGGRGRGGC